MTEIKRKEIFAKEMITTSELADLFGMSESRASLLMKDIKFKVGDKLGINGKILIEDYLKWVEPSNLSRYGGEITDHRRSVNVSRTF